MSNRAVEKNLETSIRPRRLLTLVVALAIVLCSTPIAAHAQEERTSITIVEISGLVDRIQARFLQATIANAPDNEVVVVRLDSPGATATQQEMDDLIATIERSNATVAVWVGPRESAKAEGGAKRIVDAADVAGDTDTAPTLGDFVVDIEGVPTTIVRREGRPPQREMAKSVTVQFAEPAFTQQVLHAVSTPSAAYLLIVIGMLLVVFELFTGGIGVAAAVAALCLVLGAFGLGSLPANPIALALVVAGVVGLAIDVQVGVPRAWTAIGTVLFTAGSFFLLSDGRSVPLLVVVIALAGALLFMVAAMPAVVRARYSTPTIGRDSMVGELGTAATDVAPDGVVSVRDAPWRARTNRATPITAGDLIRVIAIDGLLLEVEPLDGAARDAGH